MKINVFSFLVFFCAVALIGVSGSEAFGQDVNLALNKNATQSSVSEWGGHRGTADKAVDGKPGGGGLPQTAVTDFNKPNDSWFEVDLGSFYKIKKIILHPRTDCCPEMNKSAFIIVTDHAIGEKAMVDEGKIGASSNFFKPLNPIYAGNQATTIEVNGNIGSIGRYVRVQMNGWGAIQLGEIEVYGEPTPVAGYAPNPGKAWNAVFQMPFDPNYPNFRGATDEYLTTLKISPKIVGVKNSAGSFDIAFQDHFENSKLIKINTYESGDAGYKKNAAKSMELPGLGVFGGFAKDASGNRYVFTGTPWSRRHEAGVSKVYKNDQVLWDGKFYNNGSIGDVESFLHWGGSRLAVAGNSLLITANFAPSHPYQVILDTQDKSKNNNRAFFESTFHHNFGQRLMFDGTDFVIMENRDHDVSVTLTKVKPSEVFPLTAENRDHALKYAGRIFSVYSTTNMNNHTYTELGNVEKGFGDNGYLVLFASERDWDYKMTGYTHAKLAPRILSPRDIGLVHVKKDFEKEKANWVNAEGNLSMCPNTVDNSSIVNSTGEKSTIKYRSSEDGWDWAVSYNSNGPCKNNLGKDRTLETKGVKWVTNYDPNYAADLKAMIAKREREDKENVGKVRTQKEIDDLKAAREKEDKALAEREFTSANHPKLVRISPNKYVVLWEEWKAKSAGYGDPAKQYLTTKAALITLKAAANGEVNIESTSSPKDLGKVRLMPGDDAFEFDGKAAWAVGDVAKGKLMFYTVDAALNFVSHELEL